jgi:DUF971 family protein
MGEADIWPSEIRLLDAGRRLRVSFENGESYELTAEHLRVRSPSAEVRGHSSAGRKTIGGKRDVAIKGVSPVGSYAVRLEFDDRHDTGLYTWRYLHALGVDRDADFALYLRELDEKGLDRDRPGER